MKVRKDHPYASDEELYFSYYLKELKEAGLIIGATYQPEPFVLCEESFVPTAGKPFAKMQKKIFTADWEIRWHPQARDRFFTSLESDGKTGFFYAPNGISFIDVKGMGFRMTLHTSDITFPDRQSLIWNRHGIYVQAVIVSNNPKSVFERTFTPKRIIEEQVYVTDALNPARKTHRKGESKLNFRPFTLEEFMAK